ncbi:MAG: CoB--CoM heterodisulfide reductase iron-sulfur subunit B family protein [Candidatus Eiseniibacteriota bacterium]|nr:MAG: CoB--CoM heterodisulfide reductase iron-sulfur subunit B family protein [Candidatus Eisenbacteria bacterium]
MDYTYYPGCSLEVSNKAYDISARNVVKALGANLVELEDWNCCGATNYMSVRELRSFAISARNLALAEKQNRDVVTACSACFTTLNKTHSYMEGNAKLRGEVNDALSAVDLKYDCKIKVRHLLDVLVNDIGIENIASKTKVKLEGLRVVPYYGCQLTRPNATFDDAEFPTTMDALFKALGAEVVDYPLKTKCCGGMLMTTAEKVALKLVKNLLDCAVKRQAHCIVTPCPLCHFNLDAYQDNVNKMFGTNFAVPTLFFTQLIGVALGLSGQDIALGQEIVPAGGVLSSYMGGRQ